MAEDERLVVRLEATTAGMAMRDAIGKLDAWGYDGAADALRQVSAEMDEVVRAFRDGEISGEDFATKLGDLQLAAQAAFDELEAGDRVSFEGVTSQLGRLGGVISGIISLANQMKNALATAAGTSSDQQSLKAMRDRHAAEQASMDSQEAMTEANDKFTASEQARNTATKEQIALEREMADVRKRAKDMGATLTDAEVQSFASAALAGDTARSTSGRTGGGGSRAKSKGAGGSEREKGFDRDVQQIRQRTDALNIEAQVLAAAAASGETYGDMMAYATEKARLLAAAQEEGRQITPELAAQIDQLARAYAEAGHSADEAKDRINEIQEAMERGKDALEDMFGSIIDGSASAKDAFLQLLAEIVKVQALKSIMAIPGVGGIAAGIGGLLSFDGGGYTGDAPRTGGMDGKGGFLAVMHPRETVSDHTKGQSSGSRSKNMTMNTTIDLRGTSGDKELDAKLRLAGQQILATAKRQVWGWVQEDQMRKG